MIDGTLVHELCATSSNDWPKVIERHEAVSAYLQVPKASTTDVDRFAAQTGMSRRMFYRLIARRREQLSGSPVPKRASRRGRPLLTELTQVIAMAISNVQPGSRPKDIIEEVSRLSHVNGQPIPSDFSIISRLRVGGDIAGLKARLPQDCPLIIDACCTDLELRADNEQIGAAWLLALIECESGRVLACTVCCGPPNVLAVATFLIASHDKLSRWNGEHKKIGVTRFIAETAHSLSPILQETGFITCKIGNAVRSGEALYLLFGQKLGRIRLRPRPRREAKIKGVHGVEITLAVAVVTKLVERANSGGA